MACRSCIVARSQLSYGTMALPLAAPILAAAMAYPLPGLPAVATIAYAGVVVARRLRPSQTQVGVRAA